MKKKMTCAVLILAMMCSMSLAGVMSAGASAGPVQKENGYMAKLQLPTEEQ